MILSLLLFLAFLTAVGQQKKGDNYARSVPDAPNPKGVGHGVPSEPDKPHLRLKFHMRRPLGKAVYWSLRAISHCVEG